MLSLSQDNCTVYKEAMVSPLEEIGSTVQDTVCSFIPDACQQFDTDKITSKGPQICDYLTWAYYNVIPLNGTSYKQNYYKTLATEICPNFYYNKVTQAVVKANKDNGNIVATGFL